jgi:hypothetical protein
VKGMERLNFVYFLLSPENNKTQNIVIPLACSYLSLSLSFSQCLLGICLQCLTSEEWGKEARELEDWWQFPNCLCSTSTVGKKFPGTSRHKALIPYTYTVKKLTCTDQVFNIVIHNC